MLKTYSRTLFVSGNFIFRSGLVLIMLVFFLIPRCEARPSFLAKSKYFSMYGPADLDVFAILSQINYDYFLQIDGLMTEKRGDPKTILGDTLDAIFLESARILGIHIYSFEASLEFLPDRKNLKVLIKNLVGIDAHERAFYVHDEKTIYVSLADLTVGVLGHEMAHAIICHHFGAPPAANIQEILAGYVDYTLSKSVRISRL